MHFYYIYAYKLIVYSLEHIKDTEISLRLFTCTEASKTWCSSYVSKTWTPPHRLLPWCFIISPSCKGSTTLRCAKSYKYSYSYASLGHAEGRFLSTLCLRDDSKMSLTLICIGCTTHVQAKTKTTFSCVTWLDGDGIKLYMFIYF
jgi:hypothetical protein